MATVLTCGAALLVGALLTSSRAVGIRTQSDSAAVASAVEQYHKALGAGDSAAAMALLASDVVILESGDVETRAEYQSHDLSADIEFARAVTSSRGSVKVVLHGDVAWAISTSKTRGAFRGRPIDSQGAELMVLTRERAAWRIRAIHWSSHSLNPSR